MRILKRKEKNLLLYLTCQNPKTHFGPKRTLEVKVCLKKGAMELSMPLNVVNALETLIRA